MDYRYSTIVDLDRYETLGLCDEIPLRQHLCTDREDAGAIRAQKDWAALVGPLKSYRGGLGPEYSFMQVTVPECLPDRLEVISYANEFAFLYDDLVEDAELNDEQTSSDKVLDVFRSQERQESGDDPLSKGVAAMRLRVMKQMMQIDKERAEISLKAWATFVQQASSHARHQPFSTLDQYLPWRIIDAGEMLWYGTVTFGMGLTIPPEHLDYCMKLTRPAFAALSLANDLLSWPKEKIAAEEAGQTHVVNAIWVLMDELDISEEKAKEICREKTRESVAAYRKTVERTKGDESLPAALRAYVEAMQYSISGNVVWSLQCPRYHPTARFSESQWRMMREVCHGTNRGVKSLN